MKLLAGFSFTLNAGSALNVAVFALGWVIFVLTQAQNSIRSSTNGLQGRAGWQAWFSMHAIDLIVRAFFSALGYGFILNTVSQKLSAVGFTFTATTIAGFGGFGANALLYQVVGLLPGLRVEVGELAPPEASAPPNMARVQPPTPPTRGPN